MIIEPKDIGTHVVCGDEGELDYIHTHGMVTLNQLEIETYLPENTFKEGMSVESAWSKIPDSFKVPYADAVKESKFELSYLTTTYTDIDDIRHCDSTVRSYSVVIFKEEVEVDVACGQYLPYRFVRLIINDIGEEHVHSVQAWLRGKKTKLYTDDSPEVMAYLKEHATARKLFLTGN